MNRKKEMKLLYKEEPIVAGIFQIKNTVNQKVFLKTSMNMRTMNGQFFQLALNGHRNARLQAEWNTFGKDAFVCEVLETLPQSVKDSINATDALRKLEEKWLEALQPYGERGYHEVPAP